MNREELVRELKQLKEKVTLIENELSKDIPRNSQWPPQGYYATYHVLAGMMLGFFAAGLSLIFNVVGSVIVHQHPLELIRVYLTFPLGESALRIESGSTLALGCCLYLGTGAFYGMIFHLILSRFFDMAPSFKRFMIATFLGVILWAFNYYAVLSWAQPMFFGGSWIVDMIPLWVAVSTHVVFAWGIFFMDAWARFDARGHCI